MECKDQWIEIDGKSYYIGIYPEWNVKPLIDVFMTCPVAIGIYPEWNVKFSLV